ELMETGIKAMLASLDPYTNYISEDRIEEFRTENTGQYAGIGIQAFNLHGKTIISAVAEGYPGAENGLKIGDQIVKVNGIDITRMNFKESDELLKGQVKTQVVLSIKRFNVDHLIEISFIREKVKIAPVPFVRMVDGTFGYFKLNEFTMNCSKDVKKALQEVLEEGAKGIIFDLRGNPGGLLMEAVSICNLFIPKGYEVVSTRGKFSSHNTKYLTLNSPTNTEIPIVILVNGMSASASEIVAGTLQDYDRAVVIGTKSYGKGLVQISRPLSYNSQLKVTTAKYYIPSGRCIQVLDYSSRNEDGSVGKIADSLKTIFKTKNGRPVMDGGGIDPDIEVEEVETPKIAESLLINGLIFEFATEFYYSNKVIEQPENFEINDYVYNSFKNWLHNKEYSYETEIENQLIQLEKHAVREKYYDQLKPDIERLQEKLKTRKETDLELYQSYIRKQLKEEIIRRYYNDSGIVAASLDDDPFIMQAKLILNDHSKYKMILN
ncbi:MAG: S41 family peptidase, partial [Cyclobacteriaceae bacterium]|nr:S41 family peptidase [Cyclobacteriaceae bacterium]